ncbi:hypothetical protein HG530_014675 [Fusarium avenaceum]|nr:hypothetical protein HG530_014675 [Fusarium avenaceum]
MKYYRHEKLTIQFLKGHLLGLTNEAENHAPSDKVESGVEAESSCGSHDILHSGEGQAKNTSEGVVNADGPSHTLLSLDGRENLSRVLKGNGTDVCSAVVAVVEKRQATSQEEDAHEWESSQCQKSSSLGIDQEESRDGKDNLNGTVAQRGIQGFVLGVSSITEDTRTVERDDVDTAHLLGQHDSTGTVVGSSDSGNREAVPQTAEVASAGILLELHLVNHVGVVEVASTNDGMSSELRHRNESLGESSMLHQPSRRLGTEVDAGGEEEGGDKGRTEFESPGDVADILDDDVGAETEEDTLCWLLPEHDEGTSNASRSHLSRINRHGSVLGSDTNSHDKTDGEKLLPVPGETRGDRRSNQATGCDEDLSTSTKVVVERIDNKGTAKEKVEENDGVDDTNNPIISRRLVNAKLLGERQVSTIGTCLIPALDESGSFVVEKVDLLEVVHVAGDESCSAEEIDMFGHAIALGEEARIGNDLVWGFVLREGVSGDVDAESNNGIPGEGS